MRSYEECRCFIDHLLAEHRRVHRMLRDAHDAIAQFGRSDEKGEGDDVVSVLRKVRDELEHHFAEEEAGGCMEEAVARCPALSAEADRIEAEHPELLHNVDRLIAQAVDGSHTIEKRVALEEAFDELCRNIEAHEKAENVLLRQGFGANLNGFE